MNRLKLSAWIFFFSLVALTSSKAHAYRGPEPEANYARLGISTFTVPIATASWTLVPSSASPATAGRSALTLDLLNGATAQSVRVVLTTSTLPPEQQYGVGVASAVTPGEFEIRGSDLPLTLDINSDLFAWVCTTSTFYKPSDLPRISAQERRPRE